MLQARKLEKLEEMEGKIKRDEEEEEEPKGKVVVGPSGEAIVYSSGNIPLFLSLFFMHFINFTTFYYIILLHDWMDWHPESCFPLTSWLIFLTDESDEEEEVVTGTKEEQGLWVIHAWMEEGGCLTLDEREAQGLLCEVLVSVQHNSSSLLSQFALPTLQLSPTCQITFFFLFLLLGFQFATMGE